MKTLTFTVVALAALAVSPLSAKELAAVDADASGTFSIEELQAAYPELTAEAFTKIDLNADGEADLDEVQAAMEAGLLMSADQG